MSPNRMDGDDMTDKRYRVAQWGTGFSGKAALRALSSTRTSTWSG